MNCPWLEWMALDGWLGQEKLEIVRQRSGVATELSALSEDLVSQGLLTPFQAKALLVGQARRLDCGRYRIRKPIGKGGMGEVFAAEPRDRRDIPVAIKILELSPDLQPEDRKRLESRFLREMKAGRNVHHPNVTKTVDFGRDADRFYLVMPRLRGPSFAALIEAKNQRPELKTVLRVAGQVIQGLKAIHAAGLVHRDLKPSNIVYDGHKRWMILDLGLAKALGDRQSLTRPGVILGTLDYAAPEQLRDASKVESPADYYALGCILYHALAGHVPFDGGDAVSKIYRHRMTPPASLKSIRPELPPDLTTLVDELLAKKPEDRPTGDALAVRIDAILSGRSGASSQEIRTISVQTAVESSTSEQAVPMAVEEPGLDLNFSELSEEELPGPADENWSEPSSDLDLRSRLVVSGRAPARSSSKNSVELAWAIRAGLILLLLAGIFFFLISLSSFIRLFV